MNKLIKFVNHPLLGALLGDRGLRVYKKPVDRMLGIPGLSELVKKVTGDEPKLHEAYAFVVKKQNAIKILTRNPGSSSLIAVFDDEAKALKEGFIEMTLL